MGWGDALEPKGVNSRNSSSDEDFLENLVDEVLQKYPKSIPEAISEVNHPQASTYRRAKELIQDGLLTMVGHTQAKDGRKVNEYTTTLNRATFDFQDKGLFVSIKLNNKFSKATAKPF